MLLRSPSRGICSLVHSYLTASRCPHLWIQLGAHRDHTSCGLLPINDKSRAGVWELGFLYSMQDSSHGQFFFFAQGFPEALAWPRLFQNSLQFEVLPTKTSFLVSPFPGCQTCSMVWRCSWSIFDHSFSFNKSLANLISSLCSLIRGSKLTHDPNNTWFGDS